MPSDIKDHFELARKLERDAFLARFPHPVLIRRSQNTSLAPREEYGSTLKMRIDRAKKTYRVDPSPPAALDKVTAIAKSDRNSFANKVLVGRTETNDLVVSHMTVSKHHAFFQVDELTGALSLTDTDSTNGTQLNGQVLEARQPQLLSDGDQVAFGDMEYTFYTAEGFFELLQSFPVLR
jgi:hypothetical protein